MSNDAISHIDYLEAFSMFMRTGEQEGISNFLKGERPEGFLSVYRNGYLKGCIAGLESNFPALQKLWGEDYFRQLAGAYVNHAPPSSATLVGYGFKSTLHPEAIALSDFIESEVGDLVKQFPYALDICALEQAWLEALNENGDDFLTLEAVQELIASGEDLSELPIGLVDSCQLVDLRFDLLELWGTLRFGEMAQDQNIALQAKNHSVIFWQRELQVQAKPLSPSEAALMQSLKQNNSFSDAMSHAQAQDESLDVSSLFADLLNAQLLRLKTN